MNELAPGRFEMKVDWKDIEWVSRTMAMRSLDWDVKLGGARHLILFSDIRASKAHRARMNALRAPNRRRRSYWTRVALKLESRAEK